MLYVGKHGKLTAGNHGETVVILQIWVLLVSNSGNLNIQTLSIYSLRLNLTYIRQGFAAET